MTSTWFMEEKTKMLLMVLGLQFSLMVSFFSSLESAHSLDSTMWGNLSGHQRWITNISKNSVDSDGTPRELRPWELTSRITHSLQISHHSTSLLRLLCSCLLPGSKPRCTLDMLSWSSWHSSPSLCSHQSIDTWLNLMTKSPTESADLRQLSKKAKSDRT